MNPNKPSWLTIYTVQASFLGCDILMNPERIPPMVKDYYWDKQVKNQYVVLKKILAKSILRFCNITKLCYTNPPFYE